MSIIHLLFIFLILENILERYIPILGYSDEVITVFLLLALIFRSSRLKYSIVEIGIIFLTFGAILLGWIGNIRSDLPIASSYLFKDALALSKFFIVYIAGFKLFKDGISAQSTQVIIRFSQVYIFLLLIFGLISQAVPLGMTGDIRFSIKSYLFLYSHQTFLVSSVIGMVSVLVGD